MPWIILTYLSSMQGQIFGILGEGVEPSLFWNFLSFGQILGGCQHFLGGVDIFWGGVFIRPWRRLIDGKDIFWSLS